MGEVVSELASRAAESREASVSAVIRSTRWLRAHWLAFLLSSSALLLPCFWHRHIQACDLGSHLYTAWLTQVVSQGYVPGLHLERQYTNVLVDVILSRTFPYLGATGAERFTVALCVLIFFWSAFAFASAAARTAAWSVAPLLAMISYGAIFHWGFFNFYLSAGFSLLGLAIIVAGKQKEMLLLPVLFGLAALAHPLGAACLVALGIYFAGLRWLPAKYHLVLTSILVAIAFAIRTYVVRHFEVLPREANVYWLLGADQLVVFGRLYVWIGVLVFALCAVCILLALRRQAFLGLSPWLQFYLAVALIVCLSPGGLSSDATFGMMGYLPDRASLYSAVALAALVAVCSPRKWFVIGSAMIAIAFFFAIFRDTNSLDRREAKVAELVRRYHGQRVIGMLPKISGWRIHENHALDRACIEVCYAYANYEPSTGQFRLKADPGNRIVDVDQDALDAMQDGSYVVRTRDLPLAEVYACGPGINDLCITELHAGQPNGDVPGISAER